MVEVPKIRHRPVESICNGNRKLMKNVIDKQSWVSPTGINDYKARYWFSQASRYCTCSSNGKTQEKSEDKLEYRVLKLSIIFSCFFPYNIHCSFTYSLLFLLNTPSLFSFKFPLLCSDRGRIILASPISQDSSALQRAALVYRPYLNFPTTFHSCWRRVDVWFGDIW